MAPVTLRPLIGLPDASLLWPWQPAMGYHIVDEGRFGDEDLARRDALPALLFRLENLPDPAQVVGLADEVLRWFARHPGFDALRPVFAALLGAMVGPLGSDVRVPEGLSEVRTMLATRAEAWKQQWLQEGRLEGEAGLLLRQLERKFGTLPAASRVRVATADAGTLETWGLRLLDADSLDDVMA